jgi:transposase
MAAFYRTAVLPTRPYKPKDKAKVENAVLVVQRWILAKLRHQTFVGLTELNLAISKLLKELNQKPFKKLPGSCQSPP